MSDGKKIGIIGGLLGLAGLGGYLATRPKKAKSSLLPQTGKAPAGATAGSASAAVAAASQFAPAASQFADFPRQGHVTTASTPLTLRATANASGAKVASLPKGSTVTITGPAVAGDNSQAPQGWFPVTVNDQSGFASGKFIS